MSELASKTRILITVGTTEFDPLVKYADSQEFMDLIAQAGFAKQEVLIQFGATGKYVPSHPHSFRLSPNIQQVYSAHEVIITHGGAGTLLACLFDPNPNKKVVAVANNSLANNHQTELVGKLHHEGYALGFESVEALQAGSEKLLALLRGELKLRKYQRAQKSLLNTLVFGEDK